MRSKEETLKIENKRKKEIKEILEEICNSCNEILSLDNWEENVENLELEVRR